jgi:hypothetical protein
MTSFGSLIVALYPTGSSLAGFSRAGVSGEGKLLEGPIERSVSLSLDLGFFYSKQLITLLPAWKHQN